MSSPNGPSPPWPWVTLADITADAMNGFGRRAQGEGVPRVVLRLADIDRGEVSLSDPRRINATPSETDAYKLHSGDLLVIRVNGSPDLVGRFICFREANEPVLFCDHFIRTQLVQGIEPRFIRFFADTRQVRRFVDLNKVCSAGQNTISQSTLGRMPVPVPPHAEQDRIVAKIEELFSDLDAGVAALKRVKANLKRYRASVLKAAVEGHLGSKESRHSPSPSWKPIGEVIHDLKQGWSPKCESVPAQDESEWAVMTTTAIQPLRFASDENKRLPKGLSPRTDLEVRVGDMMITRAGPRTRAGVSCLVRSTRKRLILCDKAYRFQCDEKQIRGAYLEIALNADPVLRNLEKMKTGISDSGVNLTQPRFRELLVPVPLLPVQDRIVADVDRRLSVADAVETEIEHGLQRASRLRQAILKHAFEGRLVPQDPSDEPAAAVLDRIKAGSRGHQAAFRNRGPRADNHHCSLNGPSHHHG